MMRSQFSRKRPDSSSNDHDPGLALAISASLSAAAPSPAAVAENDFFTSYCKEHKRRLHVILGDGNCLFRCIHHLHGTGSPDGSYYRQLAANQMRSQIDFYRQNQFFNADGSEREFVMDPAEFMEYINALERGFFQNSVVYGDHLCLLALASALNVTFHVVSRGFDSTASLEKVPLEAIPDRPIYVLAFHKHMYAAHHYNLLLPQDMEAVALSDERPQVSQFAPSNPVSQFAVRDVKQKETRKIITSSCTITLLCAAYSEPHTEIRTSEGIYASFGKAVQEARDTLHGIGRKPVWAPQCDNSVNRWISIKEQQDLINTVLEKHPRGSLFCLLQEANAFTANIHRQLAAGKITSGLSKREIALNRSYMTQNKVFTAPSQRFRTTDLEGQESSSAESRRFVQEILDTQPVYVRRCMHCGTVLLGERDQAEFGERDGFCCGFGDRRHDPWHALPKKFDTMVFTKCARVINCLLSPTTIHGAPNEGIGYRNLSYQAPVMTINGQLYARFMRNPSNCWFLHDALFDERLHGLLQNAEQREVLHEFHKLLVTEHSFRHLLVQGINILDAMRDDRRVWVTLDEDTRMCSVYVTSDATSFAGPRRLYVLGANSTIEEDRPEWELLAYPLMHYKGDGKKAWFPGKKNISGRYNLNLGQYLRSVILTQKGFWKYGRLAEQFVLDTWARQEQMHLAAMKSEKVQGRLRDYAQACGRTFGPEKVFLPSTTPGSYAYQRRFFHDVLHLSRTLGASHLFITFTCNPNWPEIAALGGSKPDFACESHQADIARVFTYKRKQLIKRLKSNDYLFEGHRGIIWLVYCVEWQKGDLPHAHIACRLNIDTSIQPMATQQDQLDLMDKIVCARKPPPHADHYHQVIAFMQHPEVCKSCLKPVKGGHPGEKRCRFRFPKPENDMTRIDMKGFPVYVRGPKDIRIVPYNIRALKEFNCHSNWEFTFLSHHFGYLYKYICKGIDHAGFRIRDQQDEIAAHHSARILTPAETVYKSLGFNLNYRSPAVIVCHIHLPRDRNSAQGEVIMDDFDGLIANDGGDVFGDQFGEDEENVENVRRVRGDTGNVEFVFDFIDEYFKADREDDMLFCDFYEHYQGKRKIFTKKARGFEHLPNPRESIWNWSPRQRSARVLARMPWYPPTAGAIFFLRVLLLHIPARSFADLYGGFPSFKEHCLHLNLIDNGEEYLHGMRDAIDSGRSPAECRHLFALFLNCVDVVYLQEIWDDQRIRKYLIDDFLPSEANGEVVDGSAEEIIETACAFALMDIASMVDGMGADDFCKLFQTKGLPDPAPLECMAFIHVKMNLNPSCTRVFKAYAAVVGYSIRERSEIPFEEREIARFREKIRILTEDELELEIAKLNPDQLSVFTNLINAFKRHQASPHGNEGAPMGYLHNINASAGCGKTFLINRFIAAVRMQGHVTISVCSIGIGALHFDDGRTVHSMFKIPLKEEKDVIQGVTLVSTLHHVLDLGKTNARIEFLRAAQVISWDEIGTIKSNVFISVDHLMQRIKRNSMPFGGCFVVTLGDWKQCPPVNDDNERVRFWDGDEEAFCSIANLSVKTCPLFFKNFTRHRLTINERAKCDPAFNDFVKHIGLGTYRGDVPFDVFPLKKFETVEEACRWLYETDIPEPYHPVTASERSIMSPYNRTVDMINEHCEHENARIRGTHFHIVELLSVDEFICPTDEERERPKREFEKPALQHVRSTEERNLRSDLEGLDNTRAPLDTDDNDFLFDVQDAIENIRLEKEDFSTEILNAMNFKSTPPHRLRLYVGCPIILLRNLDPSNRLQNGVRLIVKDFIRGNKVIVVTKAEDERRYIDKGGDAPKTFLLHRIKFQGSQTTQQDAVVTRKQFPVRQANAMSVHKSQSMTMGRTVFDVREGVFEHGQCFVALSRNRRADDFAFLVRPGQASFRNIVLDIFADEE